MNEKALQEILKAFDRTKRKEVEDFLRKAVENGLGLAEATRKALVNFTAMSDSISDIRRGLEGSLNAVTNSNEGLKKARQGLRQINNVASKLEDDIEGIYDLNLKDLKTSQLKAKSGLEAVKRAAEEVFLLVQRGKKVEDLSAAEAELLAARREGFETEVKLLDRLQLRIEEEERLQKSLGFTGALFENLNKIGVRALGGIGINLGSIQNAFEAANTGARDAAKSIEALGEKQQKDFSTLDKRVFVLTRAFSGLKEGIQDGFSDPLVIGLGVVGKVLESFNDLNKAQTESRRLGNSLTLVNQFKPITSEIAATVDLLEQANSLTKELGLVGTSVFTAQNLTDIADARILLGLSSKQANSLGIAAKLTNQSFNQYSENLLAGTRAANKFFKSAVSPRTVIEDIANASADIVVSLGFSGDKLGRAAASARAFGLELNKINGIADSLLDFESSIQNELEAQLLTGRALNLSRAREFALTNDLAGLTEELSNNNITAAEFANMNRIQQSSIAKALGLSREELGKTLINQKLNNSLTEKQRADVLGITVEQLRQASVQERIDKAIQSISQSLIGPLEAFANLVGKAGTLKNIIVGGIGVGIGVFVSSLTKSILGLSNATKQAALLETLTRQIAANTSQAALASSTLYAGAPGPFTRAGRPDMRYKSNQQFMKGLGTAGVAAGAATAAKGFARFIPYIGPIIAVASLLPLLNDILFADDMISKPGYGGRVMLDKGGITSFNNKDYITASTNPPGSGNRRVEQLLERLIANTEKTGAVYIDGREVGTAMVMNSYKSS